MKLVLIKNIRFEKSILVALLLVAFSFSIVSFAQEYTVPSWIKNNAKWWSEGKIGDNEFVNGIQYLIKNDIVKLPPTSSAGKSNTVPSWIKTTAGWWANDKVSDKEFISALQYLLKTGIIQLKVEKSQVAFFSLMLPILNVEDPKADSVQLKKYLKPGYIVVFPPSAYPEISKLKHEIAGLEIGTGGISKDQLLKGISRIPADVDYVTYDYEPAFTPEFSYDQNESIKFFKQLHEETKKNNKKLMIVPVYTYGKDWDWGEVAKYTDVIVLQVQNYQTGSKFPPDLTPKESLTEATKEIVKQIRAKSPQTKIFLQMGFEFGSNPVQIVQDVNTVRNLGIDGVTLWYNPGTSGKTSKFSHLVEALENLEKN